VNDTDQQGSVVRNARPQPQGNDDNSGDSLERKQFTAPILALPEKVLEGLG